MGSEPLIAGPLRADVDNAVRARTTLLTQVLAVNAFLVGITAVIAVVVARERLEDATSTEGILTLALAVCGAVLLNSILLRVRLEPIGRLVRTMDQIDLLSPGRRHDVATSAPREVQELSARFNQMLGRIEDERRHAGRAVLRAQEQERSRIAQDLHDEVNQALTAILLRLEATISEASPVIRAELQETKQLATQAMEELLHLARQLRPTALDDHGLIAALASQVDDFGNRTGIEARFQRHGPVPALSGEEQLVLYRVTQESLNNIAQHSEARRVDVDLSFVGSIVLRITDDGAGFDAGVRRARRRRGGLGLSGMRERALLIGGHLDIFSAPGQGTTIELTMGAT
jgi:two-component system sensor histidine kinase UhpB